MDAERTLGSIESVALQYLEKYSKDDRPQPEVLQGALEHSRRLLAIGTELSDNPEIIDSLEMTDQEKAGFKEAFRNRKAKPKQPDSCYLSPMSSPKIVGKP